MSALSFPAFRLAVLVLALGASGCTTSARDAVPPRRGVPQRIVSLGPSGTEILVALGAMDRLVGRSRWDTWPEAVQAVPAVGDAIQPSVERILAARPDLVVLYDAADNVAIAQALGAGGVRVVALRIDSIEQFLHALDTLGTLVGAPGRADSIAATLREQLQRVQDRPARGPRPRVFIPVWDQPLMTVGSGSFLSELVHIAGGENVYAEQSLPSLTVSWEDVVRRDPDIVLTGPAKAGTLLRDPRWRALRAVREGRVVTYDTMLVSQPSTRLGEAARSLADLLHPVRR